MKYEFEKVIDGLSKYINDEFYSGMADWQEFIARLFVGRFIDNSENVKTTLLNNGFLRTFGIMDSDGMVDVDSLVKDIKRELDKIEKITISVPMIGKMTFTDSDVDTLYKHITGKEYEHEIY